LGKEVIMSTDQVDSWGFLRREKAFYGSLFIVFVVYKILQGLGGWFPVMKRFDSIWLDLSFLGVMYFFSPLGAMIARMSTRRRMLVLGITVIAAVAIELLWWYMEKKLGALIWNRPSVASLIAPIFTILGWR
jgi:hypothetical protein